MRSLFVALFLVACTNGSSQNDPRGQTTTTSEALEPKIETAAKKAALKAEEEVKKLDIKIETSTARDGGAPRAGR